MDAREVAVVEPVSGLAYEGEGFLVFLKTRVLTYYGQNRVGSRGLRVGTAHTGDPHSGALQSVERALRAATVGRREWDDGQVLH